MIDFFIEPDPKGEFGTQLKELYPIGSKVKVTVQRARLDLTKKKKILDRFITTVSLPIVPVLFLGFLSRTAAFDCRFIWLEFHF
jgi:hypothetical protein